MVPVLLACGLGVAAGIVALFVGFDIAGWLSDREAHEEIAAAVGDHPDHPADKAGSTHPKQAAARQEPAGKSLEKPGAHNADDQGRPVKPEKPLEGDKRVVEDPKAKPADKPPQKPVTSDARKEGDAKVTKVNLPLDGLLPCMVWADAKGSAFLALRGDTGLLRRFSFPDLKVTKQKALDRKFSWMSMSAQGLVLSCPEAEQVWVVDPATLEVKSKIGVPKLKRAASAPGLSWAVACDTPGAQAFLPGFEEKIARARFLEGKTQKLYVVDLAKKKAVAADVPGFTSPLNGRVLGIDVLDNPVVSPNGAYVFTQSSHPPHAGAGNMPSLFRFAFKNGTLKYVDSTDVKFWNDENPAASVGGIAVSADSKLVALASPPDLGINRDGLVKTTVYSVDNLKKVQGSLEQGKVERGLVLVKPVAVGFDPKGAFCYAENFGHDLVVYTSHGIKKQEYTIESLDLNECHSRAYPPNVQQYLVHPGGNQIVMLTRGGMFAVELPKTN
jgi:hypothetical protein